MNGRQCKFSAAQSLGQVANFFSSPAYIAGVTNPIFESSRQWDLLLDIGSGNVAVAKDIHMTYPATNTVGLGAPTVTRSGTLKAESSVGSEDDIARITREGSKSDFAAKDNNADKLFIEDVCSFHRFCSNT